MATDLNTIPSPETTAKPGDISMDTILNTGVNADRQPATPVDPNPNPNPDNPPNPDNKKPEPPKITENTEVNEETKVKVKSTFSKFAGEGELSDTDKNLRTQLLETYKGAGFNENGDIVNEKGEIVKTFDEVYTDILSEEDEKFDDKGNLIDDDGNVVKTKAQLDAEKSYVNKLAQDTGYEFKDENGNVKTYSDDEKGINEFVGDLVEVRLKEQQDAFFSQNPTLANVAKHLLSGGTLEDFQETVDYSKIKDSKPTEAQKLAYIEKSFKVKGFNDARIQASLQRIKDGNQVDEEFDFAIQDLEAHEEAAQQQRDAKYQAELERQEREIEQYWNQVQQTITQGKVNNITIPDNEKEGFFKYLAQPVKGNLSQAMIDRQKEDVPTTLLFDFLRYKGYDLSKLIDTKAKTTRVTSLRDLVARSSKVSKGDFTSTKGASKTKQVDIRIEDLL